MRVIRRATGWRRYSTFWTRMAHVSLWDGAGLKLGAPSPLMCLIARGAPVFISTISQLANLQKARDDQNDKKSLSPDSSETGKYSSLSVEAATGDSPFHVDSLFPPAMIANNQMRPPRTWPSIRPIGSI